jgi:hypothetical protein
MGPRQSQRNQLIDCVVQLEKPLIRAACIAAVSLNLFALMGSLPASRTFRNSLSFSWAWSKWAVQCVYHFASCSSCRAQWALRQFFCCSTSNSFKRSYSASAARFCTR